MAIPYNPSSFNSNKTILQAIEELKKYLQENPCYKIYMYNDDYVDGTYVYVKSGVDDPDSIEAYDVIFFKNSYYSKVESVGDSTITVWPAINFTGAEGPQGPAGADGTDGTNGADGVSITNVAIDGSNHLICTLSDGTSIDAGEIPAGSIRIISLESGLSGTLTQDEYDKLVANDFNYVIEMGGNFYHKASLYGGGLNARYTCVRKVTSVETWASDINIDSTRAWTLTTNVLRTKIQNSQIDSGAASNGQVLTADGSGGASWQTAGGGSSKYMHRIRCYNGAGSFIGMDITIIMISESSTKLTSFSSILTELQSYIPNYYSIGVYGVKISGSSVSFPYLIKREGTTISITWTDSSGSGSTQAVNASSFGSVYDFVEEL